MHSFRTVRTFIRHKFSPRQTLLIIATSIGVALAVHLAGKAAGLSPSAVTAAGVGAAIATLVPLQIVFYRRTHA